MNIDDNTRLVFHIGDPKTGTTSIQRALHHRLVACETLSILPWHKRNAVSVANGLTPRTAGHPQEPFSNLQGWLNGSNTDIAVVSSEFFSSIRPGLLQQALNEHLPAHAGSAEVLAYVRPHASRFLAAFVQRTKVGLYSGDFDGFMLETGKNNMFRYSVRFGHWRNIFGPRFTLKPFIRTELRDQDIVADFFGEILRGAPFEIRGAVKENVSVTSRALAGLRLIHQSVRESGGAEEQTHHLLGETLANWFLPMGPISGDKPRLDRRTAECLLDAYLEDAKILDSAFFGQPLMKEALEGCTNDTSEEPLDLSPSRYFRPEEVGTLTKLGVEAAQNIADKRPLFGMYQNVRSGNLVPNAQQTTRINKYRAKLEYIDAKLMELAQVLRG